MQGLDTQTTIFAVAGALLAGIVWLSFWRRADKNPEPLGIVLFCFILGAIAVPISQALQSAARDLLHNSNTQIIVWSGIEEILKYIAAASIVFKSKYLDEPIDYSMYLVASALGFATFENILFLIKPLFIDNAIVSLLAGNLRFLGATLLHTVASIFIGALLGLTFYKSKFVKKIAFLFGLSGAIALHSVFNFFIIEKTEKSFFVVYGFLWIVTLLVLMIVEKVRRMNNNNIVNSNK